MELNQSQGPNSSNYLNWTIYYPRPSSPLHPPQPPPVVTKMNVPTERRDTPPANGHDRANGVEHYHQTPHA